MPAKSKYIKPAAFIIRLRGMINDIKSNSCINWTDDV